MDSNLKTVSDAHPESMDFLSRAWCNFAVQALHPPLPSRLEQAIIVKDTALIDNPQIDNLERELALPFTPKLEHSSKVDDANIHWKSNDLKSWIWMQQAMHPELNYKSCFHKKWMPWDKFMPFKNMSIKKWLKDIKQRRKEEGRLQRAQVHAAVSVAGLAAVLAAVAAEDSKHKPYNKDTSTTKSKDAAVASAAALVAAQCSQVAEAMGAKREQLSAVLGSALTGTSASDILTLTAAASTSLKGAATLKATSGCKNKSRISGGGAPVLPIDHMMSSSSSSSNVGDDDELFISDPNYLLTQDFESCRLLLAKGAQLTLHAWDGKCISRLVSIILSNEAKVILKIKPPNLLKTFTTKKESIILDLHAELYKGMESEDEQDHTCYLIVLTTNQGILKLDMKDDRESYKMWATTINRMLMLSTSFTRYELQFYEN